MYKYGTDVLVPKDNQLMVLLVSHAALLKYQTVLPLLQPALGLEEVANFEHGEGVLVILEANRRLPVTTRLCLQALLGSDSTTESGFILKYLKIAKEDIVAHYRRRV